MNIYAFFLLEKINKSLFIMFNLSISFLISGIDKMSNQQTTYKIILLVVDKNFISKLNISFYKKVSPREIICYLIKMIENGESKILNISNSSQRKQKGIY